MTFGAWARDDEARPDEREAVNHVRATSHESRRDGCGRHLARSLARGEGRFLRVAQPGAHAGARRHSRISSRPPLHRVRGRAGILQSVRGGQPEVLGGQDYLDRLNAPTEWTRRVVPSFRNVARSICRVAYTGGVGSGGTMLTMRFDVDAARAGEAAIEALTSAPCRRSHCARHRRCPPLPRRRIDQQGRDGREESARGHDARAHVDRADRGHGPRRTCARRGRSSRRDLGRLCRGALDVAIYRLEFTRLKTPSSAG